MYDESIFTLIHQILNVMKRYSLAFSYHTSTAGYSLIERSLIMLHRSFPTSKMPLFLKLALSLKRDNKI